MDRGPKQTILQGGHTDGPQTYEKMLKVREMQIKTTKRYQLIPVRMAIISKSTNNKYWRECREKEYPCALLVQMQFGGASEQNSMEFVQKKNGTVF